jgi:hypothetical protein
MKDHHSSFVFPATCSLSFVIATRSPSFVIATRSPSFVIPTCSLSFVIATCSPSFVIATMRASHPTPTTIKMIDSTFVREKNYFLSFKNIAQACFRMFDENVGVHFKVSNTPTLTGWNSTMTIIEILNQLQDLYDKPNMMTLFKQHIVQECNDPGKLAQEALLQNQAMSRNTENRKDSLFQQPDNPSAF